MRRPSMYPNLKHTPDSLRDELEHARRGGSESEVRDLSLLIQNALRPKGTQVLPGVTAARNRQGARRYNRTRTWNQSPANPTRRAPRVGDHVRVPDGRVWLVTSVEKDTVCSYTGQGINSCAMKLCTIVDPPAPTPQVVPSATPGAEELYHAIWDAFELQDWAGVERALRAYEASTP